MMDIIERIIKELEKEKRLSENEESQYCESESILEFEFARGYTNGIENSIDMVNKVAAEYNNGWILCSVVDHPEHCRECEVTMIDKYGHTRDIAFYTDRWRRASDEAEIIVIAWKEPSDPYHPKGE